MSSRVALVTGGSGYIGPRLVQALLDDNWSVNVIARATSSVQNSKNVEVHIDDGSAVSLAETVKKINPTTCFHLATKFLPTHKTEDISELVTANIDFATRLAQACAKVENIRFINVGTLWQHYDAREYGPTSLYAATKQAFLDILRFYAEVEGMQCVHLDMSDTYGPNDPRPKLLQLLLRAAETNETLEMSEGKQLLDPVFIDDAVRALVIAADVAVTEPLTQFAVSSGAPVTLREYVAALERVIGKSVPIKWGARPYRPREMHTPWYWAPRLTGWEPKVGLEEGISKVVESRSQ